MRYQTSRTVQGTPDQVYAAFSDPERLALWWGPAGFTNTFDVCEFRPGGRWSFVMHGPDGRHYQNESIFAALEPSRKVVIDHTSEPRFRLTVTLEEAGEGATLVAWAQEFEDPEVARRVEPIVVPSNEQNLDRLAAEVVRASPEKEFR